MDGIEREERTRKRERGIIHNGVFGQTAAANGLQPNVKWSVEK
jgi:hypothetical protein